MGGPRDGSGTGFWLRVKNSNALFTVGEQRNGENRSLRSESRMLEFVIYSWNRSRLQMSRMWSWEEIAEMTCR